MAGVSRHSRIARAGSVPIAGLPPLETRAVFAHRVMMSAPASIARPPWSVRAISFVLKSAAPSTNSLQNVSLDAGWNSPCSVVHASFDWGNSNNSVVEPMITCASCTSSLVDTIVPDRSGPTCGRNGDFDVRLVPQLGWPRDVVSLDCDDQRHLLECPTWLIKPHRLVPTRTLRRVWLRSPGSHWSFSFWRSSRWESMSTQCRYPSVRSRRI